MSSPQLNKAARRKLPKHISATTVTAGGASTITLSAHVGKVLLIQVTAKTHINAGGAAATTSMGYLVADQREEFEVTNDRTSISAISASGSASVRIAETGD